VRCSRCGAGRSLAESLCAGPGSRAGFGSEASSKTLAAAAAVAVLGAGKAAGARGVTGMDGTSASGLPTWVWGESGGGGSWRG